MNNKMSDDMKDEYDFSNAARGRFFRQDAVLVMPSLRAQAREPLPKGNINDTK